MPKVTSIDAIIIKLENRAEPLSVDQARKLGKWLREYVAEHDEHIMGQTLLRVTTKMPVANQMQLT